MKLEIQDGRVVAIPSNENDLRKLVALTTLETNTYVKRKYRKQRASNRKTCDICGLKKKRLGLHMALAHEGKHWATLRKNKPVETVGQVSLG